VDLALITHWTRRWLADGVVLAAPDPGGESLRIRTRQRPLRPFRELLGAAPDSFERLTTVEGEHAGLAITARDGEARATAMIVGDDNYTLVEGRSSGAERVDWIAELVRTIARCYPLGLGAPRRRRYLYAPPPGFQALAREGCVCWLDLAYPRSRMRITVHDARPLAWFAPGAVDRFLFVDENPFAVKDAPVAPLHVIVRPGLAGPSTRATGTAADGTPLVTVKTLVQDTRYYYAVQLEARADEWTAAAGLYQDVLRSIEPVPASELRPSVQAFMHWSE
jgi:hypothetical protein